MILAGAKWQKERSHSEEEVYKIAKNAFELYRNDNLDDNLDDNELEQEFERVIKIWLKKK